MNVRLASLKFSSAALAVVMTASLAVAQDGTKQDMKSAGHETKNAAIDTGHGVKTGTKKAYHKTKHGVKHAFHATKNTLDPHKNSQDASHQ